VASPRNQDAFLNSFMRGFSFVDDINQRKAAQKKLDARLEEERADRQFRRDRLDQIDTERAEDRQIAAEDRTRVQNERELGREGDRLALDPQALTDPTKRARLMETANFSANAFNTLAKEMGRDQVREALKAIPSQNTQTGGLNSAVTGNGDPGGIDTPITEKDSLLGESQGRDSFQSVDLDEISQFDTQAPGGGFLSQLAGDTAENFEGAGDRITGAFRGLSTGAANLVQSARGEAPVDTGASFGDAVGGNINVSRDFTSEEEFASINDPAEFEQARLRNDEIIKGIHERGVASLNEFPGDISRLDSLKAGNRADRAEAQRQEFIVEEKYSSFSDPTKENTSRSLAAEDPQAGVIDYANDRATLQSANPGLRAQMDMQMQPAFQAAEGLAIQTIQESVAGTPEHAKASRDLRSLRVTQAQVYDDYSISEQTGIDDRGFPIGNSTLSNQVNLAIADPDRPRPMAPANPQQIQMAVTLTGRMEGNRRATDAQLNAAILLKDYGLASAEDIMTLNMTGKWPSTAPAVTYKAYKPGDVVMAQGADGSLQYVTTIPGKPGGRSNSRTGKPGDASNQLNQASISQFQAGFETRFPAGTRGNDEAIAAANGTMLDGADWIQEQFDLTDPIAANRIGRQYAGAVQLAAAEDSGWVPNILERWLGDLPTAQEIMTSPSLAAQMSVDHGIPMRFVPQPRMEGVDVNNMRQELLIPNKYPNALSNAAETMDDEQFVFSVLRYDHLREQQPQQGQ